MIFVDSPLLEVRLQLARRRIHCQQTYESTVSPFQFTFSWSAMADSGYAIQSSTNLTPPIPWLNVTNGVQVSGNQRTVTIPTTDRYKCFRLLK